MLDIADLATSREANRVQRKRRERRKGSLVEFLARSPLRTLGSRIERIKDQPRKVKLPRQIRRTEP